MNIHVNTKNCCTSPNISKTSFYHLLPTRHRAVSGRPAAPSALDLLSVKQLSHGIRAIYFQSLLYLFHFNSSQQKKSKVEKIFPRKSNNWVQPCLSRFWYGLQADTTGKVRVYMTVSLTLGLCGTILDKKFWGWCFQPCMGGMSIYIYIFLY